MVSKVTPISPRVFANIPHPPLSLSISPLPTLQHPAMSYAAEQTSVHDSLDLSFQRGITVSLLDRQLIDNLTRIKQPPRYAQLLASGF